MSSTTDENTTPANVELIKLEFRSSDSFVSELNSPASQVYIDRARRVKDTVS